MTRFQAIGLAAAVLLLLAVPAQAATLTTTFSSNNGQSGNMFDLVVAGSSLTVTSLDLNLNSGTYTLELYTKAGTWVGFNSTPGAWTLVSTVSGVSSLGLDVPTPVDFTDFVLPASSTTALYVTDTTGTGMNYSNGTSVGAVFASNADLSILEGAGVAYPFSGTFQPRVWNGTVNYQVGAVPEPATSALFVLGLGALALGHARRRARRRRAA